VIPGGLYLPDTSALARRRSPHVRGRLVSLGEAGLLATCPTVDLEVLYSARSPAEYTEIDDLRRTGLIALPLSAAIGDRAREVQALLARTGRHRGAGVVDLLTAATAEAHGATVLHYDGDFDLIAEVSGQPVEWVAERGSLD
jgi:predicted nucleic acid-binding protein